MDGVWDFFVDAWPWVLTIVSIALSIGVTIHAVLWKRDIRAAIAWTGLAWLAPLLGAGAYFSLGVNRVQRKATRLKLRKAWKGKPELLPTRREIEQAEIWAARHPGLAGLEAVGRKLTSKPLLPGNSIETLIDGDQTYPAMIDAICRAERSVALLSYIFDSDRAGDRFLKALVDANNRGVQVRVLIDDIGSRYSRQDMVRRLQDSGVNALSFLPSRFPRLPIYANLRNHRKLLVVDGAEGFTGGTNIREGHWLELNPPFPVQCLHFRLRGPIVTHLQEAFATDWAFAGGESLAAGEWFAHPQRVGGTWARGISHGPDEDFKKMADVIFAALSIARSKVCIFTPYFLPNAALLQALAVTALRGVCVEIYLPSNNNIPLVQWAATAQLWQILEKGCRVFITAPPFDHTKLMLVDDIWALIGSTNWDPRSLRLNFEFNVECYDTALIKALNTIVDRKAQGSREITIEEVNDRGFPVRLRDGLARLLSPYL